MEIDRPTNERVSCFPISPTHVTNPRDKSTDSHANNICKEPKGPANRRNRSRERRPQKEDHRPTKTRASRLNQRANPAPTRCLEHLVHQISSAKAELRSVIWLSQSTEEASIGSQRTPENICLLLKTSDKHIYAVSSPSQNNRTTAETPQTVLTTDSHSSENISFPTTSWNQRSLVSKIEITCKKHLTALSPTARGRSTLSCRRKEFRSVSNFNKRSYIGLLRLTTAPTLTPKPKLHFPPRLTRKLKCIYLVNYTPKAAEHS